MTKLPFISHTPKASILRWFLICFLCLSLIITLLEIPLISYCRSVFTELEIRKSTQQMDFGISELENTISGFVSASQTIFNNTSFRPFYYEEPDFSEIPIITRSQITEYLHGLTFPLSLVSYCAIQFSDTAAITQSFNVLDEQPGYYPFHFQVNDLPYDSWIELLKNNGSGFLPVCRITTTVKSYDALVYSMPWVNNSYFYACMNMDDIKGTLIAKENLDDYRLTIESRSGNLLYTDLADDFSDYHSVAQSTQIGNLVVTVHIPESALTERMTPLYHFLVLYLILCAIAIIVIAIIGSHLSSRPLFNILNTLEDGELQPPPNSSPSTEKEKKPALQHGFQYIQTQLQTYRDSLNTYRNTIDTQAKVLQARFLEKALHGSLVTEHDYEIFHSYFPVFPESYCLVQVGLLEHPDDQGPVYQDALSLIQFYLQDSLPNAYIQQFTDMDLLIIIDEKNFEHYADIINYLITNINREEPSYHAWGISSKFFTHPKYLPSAYSQIQDLFSRISLDTLNNLCMVSDYHHSSGPSFQMGDAVAIYSAITYGNTEVALLKLQSYRDSLSLGNRPIFEMFRSVLLCIKQEYASLLMDEDIPSYRSKIDMYNALEQAISAFCDKLQINKRTEIDPFTQSIKDYIDQHFTETDLCLTSLAEHFHCSPSKIHKAFSKDSDVSVTVYIENKRMNLANELLMQGEYTVIEVAYRCGFNNDNTFYKAYRRVFGHPPKALSQR